MTSSICYFVALPNMENQLFTDGKGKSNVYTTCNK